MTAPELTTTQSNVLDNLVRFDAREHGGRTGPALARKGWAEPDPEHPDAHRVTTAGVVVYLHWALAGGVESWDLPALIIAAGQTMAKADGRKHSFATAGQPHPVAAARARAAAEQLPTIGNWPAGSNPPDGPPPSGDDHRRALEDLAQRIADRGRDSDAHSDGVAMCDFADELRALAATDIRKAE
ncbi:hypothetical protein [Micromonospora sp. RP3T]|uniref:hypothetical protein n=1 Tax=Micromonospora sp. RP3T TaxID=2135446 RepID=UPI003D761D41